MLFVCLGSLLAACRPRAALPALDESTPPAVFREQVTAATTTDLPLGEGIQRGTCPAQVDDHPTPYFNDRVLIRLPKGATEDNFVEMAPMFARNFEPIESINCEAGAPGAMIDYMALTVLQDDDKPLETMRDELLVAFGYPAEVRLVEHDTDGPRRSGMWVYDVPATPDKPTPARALLALRVESGMVAVTLFEVHPDAWPTIVNTLVASAARVSVLRY